MKYDEILEKYGGKRCEILLYLMLSFTSFQSAYDYGTLILSTNEPLFQCAHSDHLEQCVVYVNSTSVICQNWTYDKSYFESSLITEFDLVCSRKGTAKLFRILFHVGQVVGNLLGFLGDFIGRKNFILICCLWETAITILTGLLPGLAPTLILRFLRGLSLFIYIQSLGLLSELLPASSRHIYMNAFWMFNAIAYIAAAGASYFIKDWRLIKLYGVIPNILYLFYIKFLPESPRWLILRGKKRRAEQSVRQIASLAGKQENCQNLDFSETYSMSRTRTGNLRDLFKSKQTTIKTCVLCYMQASIYMTYFGLTANVKFISENIFLSMALQGAVELPSVFVASLINSLLKRKLSFIYTTGPATLLMAAVPFLKQQPPSNEYPIPLIVATVAKFLMRVSTATSDMITSEVLPTCVRSVGLTVTNTCAILAACFSILVNGLENNYYWMPVVIYSIAIIINMILFGLFLPETSNVSLPQTVEDAEKMGFANKKLAENVEIQSSLSLSSHES